MEDDPPNPRARTSSKIETDLPRDGAAFRDRFRVAPFDHATAVGPVPLLSTPEDIEDAYHNPMAGWPPYEVMSPVGTPGLGPKCFHQPLS